jgi:leucyl-tRNA synthetase
MADRYDFQHIEKKWQEKWISSNLFRAKNPGDPDFDKDQPKYYVLVEFPYPSGEGLHVGHPRSYTALDVIARKRRMEGYNVLFPMGWDAFGLPTENYAIKTGRHPREVTGENIDNFRRQLQSLGFSFDWSREINTTEPDYYQWTQWIFLKLFNQGLAYKAEIPINWCQSCKVGLANEEVVGGECERCGGQVVKRIRRQWMLKITAYAERLLSDLDGVDYQERIKTQQRNWIGKSRGAEIDFQTTDQQGQIRVFTTRPDTIFGATYMVLAPEHPLVKKLMPICSNTTAIKNYIDEAARKSDFERAEVVKVVSGCELQGVSAINPATKQPIPIWIADYVLPSYGTGAIMAVPAHDDRDWRFARNFNLPIIEVISGGDVEQEAFTDVSEGTLVNSGPLNGMNPRAAIDKMISQLEQEGNGAASTQFKLRDWVFSRQRYWGEPIPIVECKSCAMVPVPESELPITLPEVESYQTTDDGESPLALLTDWRETTCPNCGGPALRETDTMPQWAGSSWYFLRFCSPRGDYPSMEILKYWMPVDWYNGGMEHTTLHLLYSRFWHKFLFDQGAAPSPEPYQRRTSHGMILGENREKMSKSRGNVVNPDDMVDRFGADAFRLYEMFMGAFDQMIPWSTTRVVGMVRFLQKVWDLADKVKDVAGDPDATRKIHQTIQAVSERIEAMKFNTAIAALMSMVNELSGQETISQSHWKSFLKLLAPFAPHISEELWARVDDSMSICLQSWPTFDPELTKEETITIVVQVNGKVRASIDVDAGLDEESIKEQALGNSAIQTRIASGTIRKTIYVPNKLINIVVG